MEFKEEANTVVVIMKDGEELQKNLDLLVSTFKFIPMLTVASALGMLKISNWVSGTVPNTNCTNSKGLLNF